jgi:hypothetical protein
MSGREWKEAIRRRPFLIDSVRLIRRLADPLWLRHPIATVADYIRFVTEFVRYRGQYQEAYHFYGGYTPHWYRRFLPMAGFDIVTLERNGGFFRFVGQETIRFSELLDPRRSFRLGLVRGSGLSLLWILIFPMTRLLIPLVASWLDSLELKSMATVGYHVVAVRR